MHIDRAKGLKSGDRVNCPADRGDLAFEGKVTVVGVQESLDSKGNPYIWITVKGPHHSSTWPSNRLG